MKRSILAIASCLGGRVVFAVTLIALPAVLALAQIVPREKPIPPQPATPIPAPTATPTPLPLPPNGLYAGSVEGTVNGNGTRYSFGRWTFSLLAKRCDDCDPGQYDIDGSTYSGIQYSDGRTETGTVYAYVNPSGGIIAVILFASNCRALNSGVLEDYAGIYYAGGGGEVPGSTLRIAKRDPGFGLPPTTTLSGRISGRDCFNQLIVTDVALTKQ